MSKTIAIVDDDDAVRDSLAVLLTTAGYHVQVYETSAEFLRDAKQNRFDCVILDNQMNGSTGIDLAQKLADKNVCISCVIMSGNMSDTEVKRARAAGITEILEKPFTDETLIGTIEAQTSRLG
ncbi:response regulator transcription factor [Hwanghaeella sp.]|uniref:response regulator transcription factor n=1 Tax=Hwanghaeella sp. TaxID=2605943 RepID=UPI003CCC0949